MKKIHDMSGAFIEKMLEAIKNNFYRIEKNGKIIIDYFTDYFPAYLKLLTDFVNEKEQLYSQYQFTRNMTYGGCVKYLLEFELDNRCLKYVNKN